MQPMAAYGATGIDISGITSLAVGGAINGVIFTGNGTYRTGTFSNQWDVEGVGLTTEKDEVATGNIYVTTPVTTTFSASNTPTKALGTTTAAELFRMSSPANNRLTYSGAKTRRFDVMCSLSLVASASNKYYSFYIYKNGVLLPESKQMLKLGSNVDKGSVTLSCTALLAPNDYLEVWVENDSDNSSITIETLNLSVK
jgi:hypothetical protein